VQVEGYERSRMALAKSFFENKRSSDAAKVIQRHWRLYRLSRMRQQQTEGYQVRWHSLRARLCAVLDS
jgi:hypothetical protein